MTLVRSPQKIKPHAGNQPSSIAGDPVRFSGCHLQSQSKSKIMGESFHSKDEYAVPI